MNKKAIIIGHEGQDGRLLWDLLKNKGYGLLGIGKCATRAENIKWKKKVDITKRAEAVEVVKDVQPDEIYYLAGFYNNAQDERLEPGELFGKSYQINVFPVISFLEGIRLYSRQSRFFYASSAMIFDENVDEVKNENSPFRPKNPYGISKLDGLLACRYYRESHDLFATAGILFNHESAYRPERFLSMKVIQGAVDIKNGDRKELVLGNLSAEVDWGYAPDFVEAMYRILQLEKADDFVVATGEKHSVQKFVEVAFSHLGLDWKAHVKEDKSILSGSRKLMVGDTSKLKKMTGWWPSVGFEEMIHRIVDELILKRS